MKRVILCAIAFILLFPVNVSAEDVIYSWKSNYKKIALTFDDGPHPTRTKEILDILDEYGIKATFFVVGQNAEWYSDVLKEEYLRGHEIGNHSFDHTDMKLLGYNDICTQIEATEKTVYENTEYRTKVMRPPGGLISETVLKAAEQEDYKVICWSVDTRDWAHTPVNDIVKNVFSSVDDGDIILFHDYISGYSPTADALRIIIPKLIEEGYAFVTVSELINSN